MSEEHLEYLDWLRRIDKAKLKKRNLRRCNLCSKEVPIGNVYCYNCQEEIDDALCDYDHWPYDR